jgi:hypothetical protein
MPDMRGTAARQHDVAYLTVISWPRDVERDELISQMTATSGQTMDEPALRIQCRQLPPCIIGRYPTSAARQAASVILRAGGDAFAPTHSDIQALGPTQKIKDLRLNNGILDIELWRGRPMRVNPRNVQVLIRAKLSEARKSLPMVSMMESWGNVLNHRLYASAALGNSLWFWGGSFGLAASLFGPYVHTVEIGNVPLSPDVTTHEKLDIHLNNGCVLQVDGSKFGFQILGDLRGPSDNVNVDKMCEFFVHLAPDAIVDSFFSLWRPPPGAQLIRVPHMRINNDDPAFAFYSRWAALLYRHVLSNCN